ncbi:MAG: L-seryl-tRNA(Sec) selenium transferase [Acidimicrobiales bacterium]
MNRTPAPDPRRSVPSTTALLAEPSIAAALERWARPVVLAAILSAQASVRAGDRPAAGIVNDVLAALPRRPTSMRPVLNATGIVVHTNLGRAPLSAAALEAVTMAAGYTDVEFDLEAGRRRPRGAGALATLRSALPDAEDVLVVNNGASALLLAVTALAAGRDIVWSRGELVEIGDGFRLPDLAVVTGARVREVGTTNRTSIDDYASALTAETGCILKVHPSNFRVEGFTHAVGVADLSRLGPPLVVDVGSGLLRPDRALPDEPDVASTLRAGASLVTASGDKLLGGPQLGIVAGRADLVERLRRHPLARAVRVDKLTIAALEGTLLGPPSPVTVALHADAASLRARCDRLAQRVGGEVVESLGAAGGGGAPGLTLPGWAVALPARYAAALRAGEPCVVGRVERHHCLLDLRCVPPERDDELAEAVHRCT